MLMLLQLSLSNMPVQLSLSNMPEHAWMCLYKQDSEYASGPKYGKILEFGRILNMWMLHNILNIPEYALTEFWMYLRF